MAAFVSEKDDSYSIKTEIEEVMKKYRDPFYTEFYGDPKTVYRDLLHADELNIYIKNESFRPGGSKYRAVYGLLFLYEALGLLDDVRTLTGASSGNFAEALAELTGDKEFRVEIYILQDRLEPGLEKRLKRYSHVDIVSVPEKGICPLTGRDNGRAITNAMVQGELPGYLYVDQHGETKDGRQATVLGQSTLGWELLDEGVNIVAMGTGTNATVLGIHYGSEEKVNMVAAVPESSLQVGLRNERGQGRSAMFEEVKRVSREIVRVGDREAYSAMVELWEADIPAGISTGTNFAAARKARADVDTIIMPDSAANYLHFFGKIPFEKLTGIPLDEAMSLLEEILPSDPSKH